MRRRIARARSRGPTPPGIPGSATLGTRRTSGLAGTSDAVLHSPRVSTIAGPPPTTSARRSPWRAAWRRSEEHTSELQSRLHLVCRLLLEKKKKKNPKQLDHQNTPPAEYPRYSS